MKHIHRVQELLQQACNILAKRGIEHDQSKLKSPEKELYDELTPILENLTYGSEDYKKSLEKLKPALEHHYANNTHHPEHYKNGVDDMDLFDVIEMFFDWKAAGERHKDGNIFKSIEINKKRFKLSDQLTKIFENTATNLKYKK